MKKHFKFTIHTPNFLKELASCGLPEYMGIYKTPLNEFRARLIELAEIGRRIDNPLLHLWLFDMTLYEEADPESEEYNPKLREMILKEIKDGEGKE